MKAEVDNRIYNLARQLCKNLPETAPEGILYGYIKLTSMNEDALKEYLKKGGINDVDAVVKELTAAKENLAGRELDMELLKTGLQLVITKLAATPEAAQSYGAVINSYDESTPISRQIDDAIANIPEEELAVFKTGHKLSDIIAYTKSMTVEPETAKPSSDKEPKDEDADNERKNDKKDQAATDETVGAEEEPIEIYSEVLSGYLANIRRIIPAFKESGNECLLWSQSLLLSIDDGFGLTTFTKELFRIYADEGLNARGADDSIIKVKPVDYVGREDRYHDWDELLNKVQGIVRYSDKKNKLQMIIDIDISQWLSGLDSPELREYLVRLNEVNSQFLFIFRIPYMEYRIVHEICETLSDIISVRPMIVTPDTNENMLNYMRKKAGRYGYGFTDECDEILEQGIVAEMNDGRFYGYKTLSKMVESILYDKISEDSLQDTKDRNKEITADELKRYLNLSLDERTADEQLSAMIGVEDIVGRMNELINQIKVQQQMEAGGTSLERPTIHMFFTGSPGTGKTTIARIIARKMKEAGILSKGNFYEIKGRDLCGRYVGETTPKTTAICRAAYGSVLFIDEAYELYRGGDNERDYGREAITALIAEMENHRDDMCVIMAGYTDEMKTLLESNPGLRDRVRTTIEFKNYSREELEEIFYSMTGDTFAYDDAFKDAVHEYFEGLDEELISGKLFSNGRFVRNLYENTWGSAAMRREFNDDGKLILKATDFTSATEKINAGGSEEPKRRPMGFGAF